MSLFIRKDDGYDHRDNNHCCSCGSCRYNCCCKGDPGPQGPMGPQGKQGIPGKPGPAGPQSPFLIATS